MTFKNIDGVLAKIDEELEIAGELINKFDTLETKAHAAELLRTSQQISNKFEQNLISLYEMIFPLKDIRWQIDSEEQIGSDNQFVITLEDNELLISYHIYKEVPDESSGTITESFRAYEVEVRRRRRFSPFKYLRSKHIIRYRLNKKFYHSDKEGFSPFLQEEIKKNEYPKNFLQIFNFVRKIKEPEYNELLKSMLKIPHYINQGLKGDSKNLTQF